MNPTQSASLPAAAARRGRKGFSLVEMMACVSIIGIIAFLAIPSVARMRSDSEKNLAIARAEALNLAQARPRITQWARVETILGDYLQLALIGQMPPKQAQPFSQNYKNGTNTN